MLMFLFNYLLATIMSFLLLMLAKLLSYRMNLDREKNSPFECGFDPKNSARKPLSLRFFLLAVIFLVFDIEIALLLPLPITLTKTLSLPASIASLLFFIILLMGLIHEWHEGSLDWAI
uniref:NADH-ubiquinone oxidoreductase chain 3 n=1 Tax=Neoamphitrite affinis TaxID=2716569 RepID=A0A8F9RRU4_9ANNE|nr:NADH dehydrogenase subunit 3 [Neoamphitrite affinis]